MNINGETLYATIAPFANATAFTAQKIVVATAGTPVNLPFIVIADGRELVVKAKNINKKANIFVANSSPNTAVAASRIVLAAGEALSLNIANLIWIDTDTSGSEVELLVEQ